MKRQKFQRSVDVFLWAVGFATCLLCILALVASALLSQNVAPYGGQPGKWMTVGGVHTFVLDTPLFSTAAVPITALPEPKGWEWDGPFSKKAEYKITWGKLGLWSANAVAGALWGGREAYHADLRVFEKKWGVDEYSFFGSRAWERNYEGNRYLNADGQPNPHKGDFGNTFRDYWHFSGATSRVLWVGTTFTIGAGKKQKLHHKLIDLAIGGAISATAGWATYSYLRYW